MTRQQAILAGGFALFSLVTSFFFVFQAVTAFVAGHGIMGDPYAYAAGGYGLVNIYSLSAAWRTRAPWTEAASAVISFTFFGIFLVDRLRHGFTGQLGAGVLALIVIILLGNYLAIRNLVRRQD